MKKAFFITCLFICCITFLYAQKIETIKVTGADYPYFVAKNEYKFPAYTKAGITFNDGAKASARVNYNNFKQVMSYIGGNGDTLEIANPGDIKYIAVGADSLFYDTENGYFQWVATSPTARLVAKYSFKEGPRALVGAFGTASPAKHVESRDAFLNSDGVSTKQLGKNEEVTFIKETTYYISPINTTNFVVASKKNIERLFPKKKVEDFIKENRINLNKEQDLIDLMVHISKPKN